jgi:hypothetical protein
MIGPRQEGEAATVLADGRVLITGGSGFTTPSAKKTGEVYDPSNGKFVSAGKMSVARELHTSTLLKNGKVLIAGGTDLSSIWSSAELYMP